MYVINDDYYKKNASNQHRNLKLKFYVNNTLIDNSKIIESIKITHDVGTTEYTIGSVYIPTIEFGLSNDVACTVGTKVKVVMQFECWKSNTISYWLDIPFYEFIVTDITSKDYTSTFKGYISSYNKLNMSFAPDKQSYTVQSMLQEFVSKTGVGVDGLTSLPNHSLTKGVITEKNDAGETVNKEGTNYVGKTYFEQLSYIASLLGSNIIFTRDNKIKFVKPTDTKITVDNYSTPVRGAVKYNITKLTCNIDNSTKISSGTGEYEHELIISNPYMTQSILDSILPSIKILSYEAYDFKFSLADLRLQPLDMITITHKGVNKNIPLQYVQWVLNDKTATLTVKSFTKQGSESQTDGGFKGTLTQKVENIYAEQMHVKELLADIGQFNEIKAIVAEIETLFVTDGHITNLLAGNITSDTINTIHLTAENAVIDNALITSEMVKSLAADKIAAGTIDVSHIDIRSESGRLSMADNTIRFLDENGNLRLYMGENTDGSFAFHVYDATGQGILIDENGVKEIALSEGLIKEEHLADGSVTGDKIEWVSFGKAIDESEVVLNSSHVSIDDKSLDVAFNQLTTQVDTNDKRVQGITTELQAQAGQIASVMQLVVTEDGETLKQAHSVLRQEVDAITTSVGDLEEFQEAQSVINQQINQNISDVEEIVAGSNHINPQMKTRLKGELDEVYVIYLRMQGIYNNSDHKDSNKTLYDNMVNAYLDLNGYMNQTILVNMNETSYDCGIEVNTKFTRFYQAVESLHEAIINGVQSATTQHSSDIKQMADKVEIQTKRVDTVEGNVNSLSRSFSFTTNGMEISGTGDVSSGTSLLLDADRLSFKEKNVEVAYITSETLHIERAELENELKIGDFTVKISPRGGIMFIK